LGEAAIETSGLTFTFRGSAKPALDRVSVRVEEGSFTGLLGPNGAGKTTFVNLVCGLLAPDRGELRIFAEAGASRAARRAIGFCPQELALYPTLTAAENLRFFGRLAGLTGRRLAERITAALAATRLEDEGHTRVERFSGGMKRRLNLAAALLHEPRLLLLDEPTVGVDAQSRLAIFEALEALSAAGTTIVYTTHYMEEIERLCRDVIVIDHGSVLAQGVTADLIASGRRAQTFRLTVAKGRGAELVTEAEGLGLRAEVRSDGRLDVAGEDLAALTALISRSTASGDVLYVETQRPTLEERFLELTGKELRDG
jgi:ABC-2 type transport system ATP-binding protein